MKALFIIPVFLFFFDGVSAQKAGTRDSTFGVNGLQQTKWADSALPNFRQIIPLPNGKILTAGLCYVKGKVRMVGIRHKANGTVDSSYGNNGFGFMYLPGSVGSYCYGAGLQSDQSLILGGDVLETKYSFTAARLTPGGNPDNSFGTNGFCSLHVGAPTADNLGNATEIQADDKILISGNSTGTGNFDFTVVRFTKTGKPDSTFGTNGVVVLPIGTGNDNCYSMAIQKDGKILLGGDIEMSGAYNFTLVRLKQNGQLDSSFANNGILIKALSAADDDYGYTLKVQPDQNILLGGTAKNGTNYNCCVLRIKPNGTLDSSFGTDGVFLQGFTSTSSDYGQAIAVHPGNGKIAMTLKSYATGSAFGLMLIKPNGTLDSAFGTNGKISEKLGNAQHYTNAIAIQADGKILQGGYANFGIPVKQSMYRFHSGLPAIPVGVEQVKRSGEFLISPNPASDKIEIQLPKTACNYIVYIQNSAGITVHETNITSENSTVFLSNLKPGMYSVTIKGAQYFSSGILVKL